MANKGFDAYVKYALHPQWGQKVKEFADTSLVEYMVIHTVRMVGDSSITNEDICIDDIGRLYVYKLCMFARCKDLDDFAGIIDAAGMSKNLMQNNVKQMLRRQGVRLNE